MKHVHSLQLALCAMLLAFLGACATNAPVDTFAKKAAAGYVTVQTISETATVALKAGKISKADASNVSATGHAAVEAIDVAKTLYATNPAGAEDKLATTLAILQALSAYLATAQAK